MNLSSCFANNFYQKDFITRPWFVIREVKHDVYGKRQTANGKRQTANGKRQTAKMILLPSVFSSLYSRIKTFVFAVDSKGLFSIFVLFI